MVDEKSFPTTSGESRWPVKLFPVWQQLPLLFALTFVVARPQANPNRPLSFSRAPC
jgi:hypothetical protein